MMPRARTLLIALPVLLVVTGGAGSTFVRVRTDLAQQRVDIASEWSDVDEALDERAGLIDSLAKAGQKIATFQPDTLKQIAEAHEVVMKGPAPQDKVQANDRLSNALAKLLLEAESFPRLQKDTEFLRLQEEIRSSDDHIAEARLKYNDSLEHYNARIQSFPHNFVARISGFRRNDAYFPTEHF